MLKSYGFLISAQLMVAINIVGSKVLTHSLPIVPLMFYRFVFASLFLLCMAMLANQSYKPLKSLSKRSWCYLLAQGLCAGVLFNLFLYLGLQHMPASIAGMTLSLIPAFIAIGAVIFLSERLTTAKLGCVLLAVVGLMLINHQNEITVSDPDILGLIFILIAIIPETAYYLLIKKHQPSLPVFLSSLVLNGVNVVVLAPIYLIWRYHQSLQLTILSLEWLIITGVASALFYVTWSKGAKQIDGMQSGLFTALSPLFTLFVAMMVLNERISGIQTLGMAFIIGSVVIGTRYRQH